MSIRKLSDLARLRELPMKRAELGAAIAVRLVLQSARDEITRIHDEVVEISLTAAPTDGTANKALVTLLAKQLGVKSEAIEIVAGYAATEKLVSIIGLSPQEVTRRLTSKA